MSYYQRWIGSALLCWVAACGGSSPTVPPPSYALSGVLTDSVTAAPAPGVTVTLDGRSAVSDQSGTFRFDGLAVGSYILSSSHPKFQTVTRAIAINDNMATSLVLHRSGPWLGRVLVRYYTGSQPNYTLNIKWLSEGGYSALPASTVLKVTHPDGSIEHLTSEPWSSSAQTYRDYEYNTTQNSVPVAKIEMQITNTQGVTSSLLCTPPWESCREQ